MHFDTTCLIAAFPASELARMGEYRDAYGADCNGVHTLLVHLDNYERGTFRPGQMPTTVSARVLTDGRYAVAGYWSLALKAAWEAGIVQAEILTPDQLQALTPEAAL
jgi:hypothetical protein